MQSMKINGNQIRRGHLILHEGGLWRVHKTQATKTGKSGAYNQVEMKNIVTGTKLNIRYRASESVERTRLEDRPYTFLYENGDNLVLMHVETYEQLELPKSTLGEEFYFLTDGMEVRVEFHEETPISVILPEQVTVVVAETEPSIKGQTASASYKPAILTNGVRIMVPPFVGANDEIIVDTIEFEYVSRAGG